MFVHWLGIESGLTLILEFLLGAAVVVAGGVRLARYGDVLAEKTRLGGAWVGLMLLAAITSLPELVSSLGAVLMTKQVDLAFGNLFGSNTFNLMIIAVLDVVHREGPLISTVSPRLVVPASLSVILIGLAAAAVAIAHISGGEPIIAQWGWLISVALALGYVCAARLIFSQEKQAQKAEAPVPPSYQSLSAAEAWKRFAVTSLVIVASGLWLVQVVDALGAYPFSIGGERVVLGRTFAGTIFLAAATSLPELVVTMAAFRLGATGMALGNLFGSNIFNMAIIPLLELATTGSVFASASPVHLVTALLAVILTSVAIAGIIYRSEKSCWLVGWDVATMVLLYFTGMYLVFCLTVQRTPTP